HIRSQWRAPYSLSANSTFGNGCWLRLPRWLRHCRGGRNRVWFSDRGADLGRWFLLFECLFQLIPAGRTEQSELFEFGVLHLGNLAHGVILNSGQNSKFRSTPSRPTPPIRPLTRVQSILEA